MAKLIKLAKESKTNATIVSEAVLLRSDGWTFRHNLRRKDLKTNPWFLNLSRECLVYIGKPYNPSNQERRRGIQVSVWTKLKPNYDK